MGRYSLRELADRLGLQYDSAGKVDCPFCGKRRGLDLDFTKDAWRCPKCGASGYVLNLYARCIQGIETLPEDKDQRRELAMHLREFMGDSSNADLPKPPKQKKIPVAPDARLAEVYDCLMEHSALQLTPAHKESLMARGLSEAAILRNGYRSIPDPEATAVPEAYHTMYEECGGDDTRKTTVGWLSQGQILLGLMIGSYIVHNVGEPNGVPGFFRFGQRWCYWVIPGILIPTRNMEGKTVVCQVRKDTVRSRKDIRYITVGSKLLPQHPTESISRVHFPLGNAGLSPDIPVIITEGPLKADVACDLYGAPVTFAAIPGICTTKDLLRYSKQFLDAGVSVINNGLDMDRLTNPNVRRGSRRLAASLAECGISFQDMFWGEDYATGKMMAFELIARFRQISVPDSDGTVFGRLDAAAAALSEAMIDVSSTTQNGDSVYWEPETKGIDDYLLHCG